MAVAAVLQVWDVERHLWHQRLICGEPTDNTGSLFATCNLHICPCNLLLKIFLNKCRPRPSLTWALDEGIGLEHAYCFKIRLRCLSEQIFMIRMPAFFGSNSLQGTSSRSYCQFDAFRLSFHAGGALGQQVLASGGSCDDSPEIVSNDLHQAFVNECRRTSGRATCATAACASPWTSLRHGWPCNGLAHVLLDRCACSESSLRATPTWTAYTRAFIARTERVLRGHMYSTIHNRLILVRRAAGKRPPDLVQPSATRWAKTTVASVKTQIDLPRGKVPHTSLTCTRLLLLPP